MAFLRGEMTLQSRGSPEVGLLPRSGALSAVCSRAAACCFPRKCCFRQINIACWPELKELSAKREEKYWNSFLYVKQL